MVYSRVKAVLAVVRGSVGEVGEGWGSTVDAIGSGGELVEGSDLRELVRSIR